MASQGEACLLCSFLPRCEPFRRSRQNHLYSDAVSLKIPTSQALCVEDLLTDYSTYALKLKNGCFLVSWYFFFLGKERPSLR